MSDLPSDGRVFQPTEEQHRLFDALCDGELTEADRDALEALLRDNPAARHHCVVVLDQHATLLWRHRESVRPPAYPPGTSRAFSGLLMRQRWVTQFGQPILWVTLAISAIFYGVFLLISWDLRSVPAPHETIGRSQVVARITQEHDVQWEHSEADSTAKLKDQASAVNRGQLLKIDSGLVSLELESGVKLLIEGPARWAVLGENHARLDRGRLVATVPPKAKGFLVDTPNAQLIDQGTEFGVDVLATGEAQVQVFRGAVDAVLPGAGMQPARTFHLFSRQAARLANQSWEPLPPDANAGRFTRRLHDVARTDKHKLALQAEQAAFAGWQAWRDRLRNDPDLVAYYDFEDQPHDGRLRNRSLANPQPALDGEITGDITKRWRQGRFRGKTALRFNGMGDKVQFTAPADQFGLHDSFTVAAWVWPIYTNKADLAVVGGATHNQRRKSLHLLFRLNNDRHQLKAADAYLANRPLYFPYMGFWKCDTEATSPIAQGEWSLVVFRFDKQELRQSVFINGQDFTGVSSGERGAYEGTEPIQLGSAFDDSDRYFCGLMDEVLFVRRAMTAEEIAALFEAGKPGRTAYSPTPDF